jgi:ketosteroid isomerase-like protein
VAERHGEAWVFTVENEKITRVREYRHKAAALEAAGLRE